MPAEARSQVLIVDAGYALDTTQPLLHNPAKAALKARMSGHVIARKELAGIYQQRGYPRMKPMTYEEHLDEVTTLITEKYGLDDDIAIAMVMRAQAASYFSGHDDDPSMCTLDRAHEDARVVFKKYK